jgi:hypothetical protein
VGSFQFAVANSTIDTPPATDDLKYYVVVDPFITCSSSRANINTSRSNTKGVAAPVDGIQEELAHLISLQPNPTNGIVNIKVPAELLGQSMIFTNAVGQVLSTMTIHSTNVDFDFSQMADGIYFVQVQTKEGAITKKIVKG